jgi:hypothetical protein
MNRLRRRENYLTTDEMDRIRFIKRGLTAADEIDLIIIII